MKQQKIIITEINESNQKEFIKVAKKSFFNIILLFIFKFRQAMIASLDGKINEAIIYKIVNFKKTKIAFICEICIDKNYQNQEIKQKLYQETIKFLQAKNTDIIALIKDDNALPSDNILKQASLIKIAKKIGFLNILKFYFTTPTFLAVGMNTYIYFKDNKEQKINPIFQLILFFVANMLLTLPFLYYFFNNLTSFFCLLCSYFIILIIYITTRYFGFLSTKEDGYFKIDNCGIFVNIIISILGFPYMINGNWYPQKYENTKEYNEKLARPELIKWLVFLFLPFLYFVDNIYLKEIAQISLVYLILSIIPFFPFGHFGATRIFNYSKRIWSIIFIMTLVITIMMFRITLI